MGVLIVDSLPILDYDQGVLGEGEGVGRTAHREWTEVILAATFLIIIILLFIAFLVQTLDRIGHHSTYSDMMTSTWPKTNRSISIQTMSFIDMTEERIEQQCTDAKLWNA